MSINISSQPISLTIGAENWSAWIESISIGYGEYDTESGLMPCTGTINLQFPANYSGIPSNPEYRFNPTQWRRGQAVAIAVGGSGLPCSGAALKILTPPQRPDKDISGIARLSISVGCALAYEYFPPEPNDDFSDITAGTPRTRGAIINSILGELEITSSVTIPELPIDYPLPKIEGNWLEFCGQLAYSAGYYLRCNTAGTVIAERVMNNGASGITYTIGVDESDWQPIGNVAEQAIEKLIVTGVKRSLNAFNNELETLIERQPLGVMFPDINWGFPSSLGIRKQITTRLDRATNISSRTETILEPAGIILPDENWATPASLIQSKITLLDTNFSNGNIIRTKETILEPYGVVLPDVSVAFPSGLIVSKITTKQWTKIGDQKYREVLEVREPRGVVLPNESTSNPTGLIVSKNETTEGKSSPPTDQPASDFTLKESQITSTVYASQPSASIGRERQRTIALPFADNVAQLSTFGQLFNQILTGRAFGWRFATRLSTSLLPMQLVTVIDGTQGYKFRTDALQWALSLTEAYLVFNGIEVGVFDVATPDEITFPVSFPLAPVSVTLINTNYSQRIVLSMAAELVNTNYSDLGDLLYAKLANSNYSAIDLSSFMYARLVNSNYSAVPASGDLNSKILVLFEMDGVSSRSYSGGTADFIIDEVNDPSITHALSFDFGTQSFVTGLLNNAISIGDWFVDDASKDGDLSIFDPDLNGFDFIGLSTWMKLKTINFAGIAANSTNIANCIEANLYSAALGFKTSNPVDVSTTQPYFRFVFLGDSGTTSLTIDYTGLAADLYDWHLLNLEFDNITKGIKVFVNGAQVGSGTYSLTQDPVSFFFALTRNSFVNIDQTFVYSAPLNGADFTALYNGGSGNTYPF